MGRLQHFAGIGFAQLDPATLTQASKSFRHLIGSVKLVDIGLRFPLLANHQWRASGLEPLTTQAVTNTLEGRIVSFGNRFRRCRARACQIGDGDGFNVYI